MITINFKPIIQFLSPHKHPNSIKTKSTQNLVLIQYTHISIVNIIIKKTSIFFYNLLITIGLP